MRRNKIALMLAVMSLVALPLLAQSGTQWMLMQSTLSYHMSHPMHEVDGVSHAAKGKGICQAGNCDFLIAVPVKTFDSGDTNRDLHMLESTRGAQFPMVAVRAKFPEVSGAEPTIYADLEVQFAGQTAHYQHVAFQRSIQGNQKCTYPREPFHPRVPISKLIVQVFLPFPSKTKFPSMSI